MVPGLCVGAVIGVNAIWKGVNGDQFMLLLGVPLLFLAPPFVALWCALVSLIPAVITGALFLVVSPLFREATTTMAKVALMIAGAISGLLGGALLEVMVNLSKSEFSYVPVATMFAGFVAGLAYPFSLQRSEHKRLRAEAGTVEVKRREKTVNDISW